MSNALDKAKEWLYGLWLLLDDLAQAALDEFFG